MLFHLTTDDHINEQGPAETDAGCITFASEQDFYDVAKEWPMKRLVEIWNRLPGVEAVARFTDRTPSGDHCGTLACNGGAVSCSR